MVCISYHIHTPQEKKGEISDTRFPAVSEALPERSAALVVARWLGRSSATLGWTIGGRRGYRLILDGVSSEHADRQTL